jgi:DNA-binding response OmpR family regulator
MALRVLVVEDWMAPTDPVTMLLKRKECDVGSAFTGENAVRLAELLQPDAVILDLDMPNVDGYGVARRLREVFDGKLTIIGISADGTVVDHQRMKEAGFNHHLLKPANPDELQRLLKAR